MICSKCGDDAAAYYTVKCATYCTVCYSADVEEEPSPNDHITDYLRYYCRLTSPEYAVMVDGPWGSGKTWFFENFKNLPDLGSLKFMYISLNGVRKYEEIDDVIFQRLHPVLASKPVTLATKMVSNALKASTKIDLNFLGLKESSINAQVPNVSLSSFMESSMEYIIVFDDFERCNINKISLLGYINQYVEHQGCKVIVLANEKEVDKNAKRYMEVKEKLIGHTFCLEPDTVSAVNNFLSSVDDEVAKAIIKSNISDILYIYNNARYKNLRHLKYSFHEFSRFIKLFPEHALAKNDFIVEIVKVFMALSIELKAGNIKPDDLQKINGSWLRTITRVGDGIEEGVVARHDVLQANGLYAADPIMGHRVWSCFFGNGTVDKELIREAVHSCSYFNDDSWPDWMKLWHYNELDDFEFVHLKNNVLSQLQGLSLEEVGVIVHVVGMFLSFVKQGLFDGSESEIIESGRRNIDRLRSEGHIRNVNLQNFLYMAHAGLGFYGRDLEDFRSFVDYVKYSHEAAIEDSLPVKAEHLLQTMMNDTTTFSFAIAPCNYSGERFYDVPIMVYIDPNSFVASFLVLSAKQKFTVCGAISDRYSSGMMRQLFKEVGWLGDVLAKLESAPADPQKPLSAYFTRLLIDKIKDALAFISDKDGPNEG